jgi:hypothetical protein
VNSNLLIASIPQFRSSATHQFFVARTPVRRSLAEESGALIFLPEATFRRYLAEEPVFKPSIHLHARNKKGNRKFPFLSSLCGLPPRGFV